MKIIKIISTDEGTDEGLIRKLNINKFPYQDSEEYWRDRDFIKEAERLNIEDVSQATGKKTSLLQEYFKYITLRVGKNDFLPIEECSEARRGEAFKHNYKAAVNRLKRLKDLEKLAYSV